MWTAQVALCTFFVTTWQLLRRSKRANCPSVPGSLGPGDPGVERQEDTLPYLLKENCGKSSKHYIYIHIYRFFFMKTLSMNWHVALSMGSSNAFSILQNTYIYIYIVWYVRAMEDCLVPLALQFWPIPKIAKTRFCKMCFCCVAPTSRTGTWHDLAGLGHFNLSHRSTWVSNVREWGGAKSLQGSWFCSNQTAAFYVL